jgi:galactose-1-phosphate uridylyltransferase
MITAILDRIAGLPGPLRHVCERLFSVDVVKGYTVPPATMEGWVERQFGAVADVREQTIVKIVNRLTLEGALFNPLRARRPGESRTSDAALESYIAQQLGASDIFREPLRDTTADRFGRIRGRFCISASNVAKCDGSHGLVIFDEPHPLHFDQARLHDYLDVACSWIAAAHAQDEQAIYPLIMWNCLPKSGATLVHGHMQIALGRGMPYGRVELWRRAAVEYRGQAGGRYFDDLFALHQALGLAIPAAGELRAFAHLTPLRNREVVLLDQTVRPAQAPQSGEVPADLEPLAATLYSVLRGLIDDQGMRAFNMAIALPPLRPVAEDWSDVPAIIRLADRGAPLATSSDWGAIELFGTGCVVTDPFEVAQRLQRYISKG